jgi:hypothetical protein
MAARVRASSGITREAAILAAAALLVTFLGTGSIGGSVAVAAPDSDCPSATFRFVFKTNVDRPSDRPESGVGSLRVPSLLIYGKSKDISENLGEYPERSHLLVGMDRGQLDPDTVGSCGPWAGTLERDTLEVSAGRPAPEKMDHVRVTQRTTTLICRLDNGWLVDTLGNTIEPASQAHPNELRLSSTKRRIVTARITGSTARLRYDSRSCVPRPS